MSTTSDQMQQSGFYLFQVSLDDAAASAVPTGVCTLEMQDEFNSGRAVR